MSINVYLKGDEVRDLDGFEAKQRRDRGEAYGLPGVKLWHEKGRWYTILHEPTDLVPLAVADIVEEITFHDWIPCYPRRETGIYRNESAEAEVELDKIAGEKYLKVRIRAKKMEDLLKLFRSIRTGSIHPEQSYEGQQGGMSYAELEGELERVRQGANDALKNLRADLQSLCRELTKGWPFITRTTLREMIGVILDNH